MGCLIVTAFIVVVFGLVGAGWWPAALIVIGLFLWLVSRFSAQPQFRNDSQRQHTSVDVQTWRAFLKETAKGRNSGSTVQLGDRGSRHELGIVGESFHLPELQWIKATFGSADAHRVRFSAYLVPEPENPYSKKGDAVRVESPRGKTIGHLSSTDAATYVAIFQRLHASKRVAVCPAVSAGGTARKKNIGVWITIGHPAWLQEIAAEIQGMPVRRARRTAYQDPSGADQPF